MMRSMFAPVALVGVFVATTAEAQDTMGAPPPDATALVSAPKAAAEKPKTETPTHETTATVSAGGQWSTGNSELVAGTVNGKFELRRGTDGFGAALIGNYGQGSAAGKESHVTTENLQGRLRYDRYLIDRLSLFAIATGRHDRFQGISFRLNLDPGVKYLFVDNDTSSLWGEAGYDFQFDTRRDDARVPLNADGTPNTAAPLLDKTATDHSGRLFVGYKHAFNKEVTFVTGIEYLQSLVDATRYRINYDALFAAGVGGGFSLGVGFSARYDHAPLPGKEDLDTVTTFNLIYAFSDIAPPAPAPVCVEPPPPPPPVAPASAPPPAAAEPAPPPPAAAPAP